MKKRSCKMTTEEKTEHEFAVKIRKMTDKQIYEFICDISEKNSVEKFIAQLESHSYAGIGPATIKKIKEFAVENGYMQR